MIIINTIEEGSYHISGIKKDKSILSSAVSDTNDNNAEVLRTLLQNTNAERSKPNPESELYRLYQQLKDDAFCTAFEKRNSVAAKVLTKNNQERVAPHKSAVNKNETPVIIGTNQVVTTPDVEEDNHQSPAEINRRLPHQQKKRVQAQLLSQAVITSLMTSKIINFLYQMKKKLKTRKVFTLHQGMILLELLLHGHSLLLP